MMPLLLLDRVTKTYAGGETTVEAVRGVSLTVEQGDFVALMGPSGCGKSTLLHMCGAMDRPTSGTVSINGRNLTELDDDSLTHLRRARIGFVFQFFNLLPTLSVLENVSLPLMLAGSTAKAADAKARSLLDKVGLASRERHFPAQLSGGEMQRAAIARAVVHEPLLLVADEPTGSLDSENGASVLGLLTELNRDTGVAVVLATHSRETAAVASRLIVMRDGIVERVEDLGAV